VGVFFGQILLIEFPNVCVNINRESSILDEQLVWLNLRLLEADLAGMYRGLYL
jgi:hypothetical protein